MFKTPEMTSYLLIIGIIGLSTFVVYAEITCSYYGSTYSEGSEYEAHDGCNSCVCTHGRSRCTRVRCLTCTYNDHQHMSGTSFPAEDECNTCSCKSAVVTCSAYPCEGPGCYDEETKAFHPRGQSFSIDECNTCQCNGPYANCTTDECEPAA